MEIIFSLVLIALGVIAAQAFLNEKLPKGKPYIDKVAQYGDFIGLGGLVFGLLWVFDWAVVEAHRSPPPKAFLALAGAMLTLALGTVYGLPLIRKNYQEPPPILKKTELVRGLLLPYHKEAGIAALGVGTLYLLASLL
jgi:hypothetical protein